MAGLLDGSTPALSLDIKATKDTPTGAAIASAMPSLLKAGIGAYRALDGKTGVLFNQQAIHANDIKAADKQGKLLELAPPLDSLQAATEQPSPSAATPPQSNTGMIPPAPPSKALKSARVNAVKPGSPTSGPKPGAGRLQNMVMQPVI